MVYVWPSTITKPVGAVKEMLLIFTVIVAVWVSPPIEV